MLNPILRMHPLQKVYRRPLRHCNTKADAQLLLTTVVYT